MRDIHLKAFAALIIGVFVACGFGQIPQTKRRMDRLNRQIVVADDAEHDRKLDEEGRLPAPKPAVMNIDVQMVLSKADVKTFAEAKAAEAKRVVDGDPLWMYLKFKSKLGDYVLTTRDPEDPEKLVYTLYAEISPKGDIATLQQYSIQFAKEDLAANEVKMNLTSTNSGGNKWIPIILLMAETTKSGVWNNDLRLANNLIVPRSLSDNLASAPVVIDFSAGSSKYQKIGQDYVSLLLRGTSDITKMPAAGTYFSNDLKARITDRLAKENIQPLKIYFSGIHRHEFASSVPMAKKWRRVFATFTYHENEQCRYGLADITETFDFAKGAYAEPEIKLQKLSNIPCEEAN
jgi:hypothetical protein